MEWSLGPSFNYFLNGALCVTTDANNLSPILLAVDTAFLSGFRSVSLVLLAY